MLSVTISSEQIDGKMTSEEQESLFRRWLDQHVGLILKVVRAYMMSPQDQEDLFQEILVQLWSSIPSFRRESRETTWIYRVAFNTALVWRRDEKRRRTRQEDFLKFHEALGDRPEPSPHGSHDLIEMLYKAIRQLPGIDASLAMMHLDGLSYREMSEVLGISESNVGVKLNRIRKHLAEQLKGVSDEL